MALIVDTVRHTFVLWKINQFELFLQILSSLLEISFGKLLKKKIRDRITYDPFRSGIQLINFEEMIYFLVVDFD